MMVLEKKTLLGSDPKNNFFFCRKGLAMAMACCEQAAAMAMEDKQKTHTALNYEITENMSCNLMCVCEIKMKEKAREREGVGGTSIPLKIGHYVYGQHLVEIVCMDI